MMKCGAGAFTGERNVHPEANLLAGGHCESVVDGCCRGQSCCLTRICFQVLLSQKEEFSVHDFIMKHLSFVSFCQPAQTLHLDCVDTPDKSPMLLQCGSDLSDINNTSLYLCNYSTWMQLRSLVQLMSPDLYAVFGIAFAHLLMHQKSSCFMWRLEMCTPIKMEEVKLRNGHMWFCMPTKFYGYFHSLVSESLGLYLERLSCRAVHEEEGNQFKEGNIRPLTLVHDCKEDLLFLSCISSETAWTTELISKYVNRVISSADTEVSIMSRISCCDVSLDKITSVSKAVINASNQLEHVACSRHKNLAEVEIEDFNLTHIKSEIKEEGSFEEMDKEACRFGVCPDANNLRKLFARYAVCIKSRTCLSCEPMLIVQCPGCFAEFRGTSTRVLRLIDHVIAKHPFFIKSYTRLIEKKYSRLVDWAKQCLGNRKAHPSIC